MRQKRELRRERHLAHLPMRPVAGPVSSPFGWRWGRMHEGVDLVVPLGTPVRAALRGRVISAGYAGGYGLRVCLAHVARRTTCYAHLTSVRTLGRRVRRGRVIGYSGCTGSCTGPHLHYEVRRRGQLLDPVAAGWAIRATRR